MPRNITPEEMELELGESLKRYRLMLNLSQEDLAGRACIGVRTLKNLAPSTFNPLTLPRESDQRRELTSPEKSR